MSAGTVLGVTKRVIVDRDRYFSPLFSLYNWLTVLREGFMAPLDYCVLSVLSRHMFHASVLTLRLTLDIDLPSLVTQ